MHPIAFNDIVEQVTVVSRAAGSMRPRAVMFYPYLKRVLAQDLEQTHITFPYTVRVAPPNKYLLKKEFDPAYVIELEKPVTMDDGTPIWLQTSERQCFLRLGYENLDARRISNVKIDMEYIHTFLGGSSGHGKSVTLNSILGGLFYEYPPWELEVNMSDAKILEFKKYGVGHRIPHISTIAATEDPDFVISVLERANREMNERAKIFGSIGASNLKSFREQTGLAYPRVLIVMDEVESTFRLAGRRSTRIAELIDNFARLGRAAGYHLLLATQNMSADIPSSAVGQIRVRMCLGANQKTSEAVLGNTGASDNIGRIGRLVVNTEVLGGGNTAPFNVKFQTPYLPDDQFEHEMEELEQLGRQVKYQSAMAFYDENDVKLTKTFDPEIAKAIARMQGAGEASLTNVPLCLGYPAFVTEDADGMLKIWLQSRDIENILIASAVTEHTVAHLHNIVMSLLPAGYAFRMFTTDMDIAEFLPEDVKMFEARQAELPPLSTIGSLVRKRMFLLQLDNMVSGAHYSRESVENIFQVANVPKDAWGNDLMCRRAVVYMHFQKDSALSKEWGDVLKMFPTFLELYKEFVKSNCVIDKVTPDKFQRALFIIGDISKIIGYGRDTKSKAISQLKRVMQDAYRVGVLFVLYSRSMEGVTDLVSGLRYTIFDAPDARDYGRLRTDAPATLGSKLALLFDSIDGENAQRKFKRTLLKEEL